MHILSTIDLQDMTELSAAFRGMASGVASMEEVAERVVGYLYRNLVLDETQEPACALVRLFVTVAYSRLEPAVREFADEVLRSFGKQCQNPDMPCFTLLASHGHKPEWNSRHLSRTFKAQPIYGPELLDEDPDAKYIFGHLGITYQDLVETDPQKIMDLSIRTLSVFHEETALGSPHIPHQDDFVVPFGIKSKLMLSGILPSGRMFGLVLFPIVPLSGPAARLFMPLSLSLKLALMPFDSGRIFITDASPPLESVDWPAKMGHLSAQIGVMDELLEVHENVAHKRTEQLKQALAELDKTAAELRRSNQELQQFAYVASHDLQEPLRAVTGYLEMLLRRHNDKLNDEANSFVKKSIDGAKRMHHLITDLLKYARVDARAADLVPIDCNEILDDVLANLKVAIEENAATVNRVPLPVVAGDRMQLTQLFQNLLANAIKFRRDTPPLIDVSVTGDGASWKFAVQDNGIGFDMAYADRVFQIFKRLHTRAAYPGTGIGLAVCKKIVERHGGTISAQSEPDKGTTIFFTLPSASHMSS